MAKNRPKKSGFSNAYEMFVLVLTVLSLAIMVMLVLPLPAATENLLTIYDNLICVVFLGDFVARLRRAPTPGQYFFHERGWLDLLGSIPSFGVFRFGGLLRLARLSRLARISRLLRGQKKKQILDDVLIHRGQYAAFVTIMAASVVLVIASIVVLSFEANAPGANITTGGEALWWAIVTMTTVGYGDFFPVTAGGRITGVFVMFMGVGIIGALASILASLLVSPSSPEESTENAAAAADVSADASAAGPPTVAAASGPAAGPVASTTIALDPSDSIPAGTAPGLEDELRAIRSELEALRRLVGQKGNG